MFNTKIISKIKLFFETVLYCLKLSWKSSRWYTVIRILYNIVSPLFSLVMTYLAKILLDLLSGAQYIYDSTQMLILIFLCMAFISLITLLTRRLSQYSQTMQDDIMNSEIDLMLIDKGISVDLEYFDNTEFYNKLLAASRDSRELTRILWNVISLISSCITFIMTFSIICGANILYGLLMIATAIPSSIASIQYTKQFYKLTLSQMEGERQKAYINSLTLGKQYAQDIRLFNAGSILKDKYIHLWQKLFSERKKTIKLRSIISGVLELLPEMVIIYVGIDISFKILARLATVGDYSLYSGLVVQLWSSIYLLSNSITQIYDNQLKTNNFKSLDQIKSRILDSGTLKLNCINTIEFENVSFSYPGTGKMVLQNVGFKVDKGEKVALVGLNGSGKSTLIKLLLRFYDVDSGEIKINGYNIKEYRIADIRKNFSIYFQDELNYSFTLRDNISIADEEIEDDGRITNAFVDSCGGDVLTKAPSGLDTYLTRLFSKDGMELSGGQNQKIALARTFFRRHTALVLDEPSSNLDPKAEHDLFEQLKHFTSGKTTIFTSHRLSNVFLADRIIVLEDGYVIEIGTQKELIKKSGRYAELFGYQKEKYQTNDDV